MEDIFELFMKILKTPVVWLGVGGIYFVVFCLLRKKSFPYIDVHGVIANYGSVFGGNKKSRSFFVVFPFLIALGTHLAKPVNAELSDLICVILSILTSMILTFMAMSREQSSKAEEKELRDL